MTRSANSGSGGLFDRTHWAARIRLVASAVILAGGAAMAVWALGTSASAVIAVSASLVGLAVGYLLGRKDGPMPTVIQMRMFRVADELAQYRAFTRLLRDQGGRITKSTSEAATVIITGLREIDASADRLKVLADHIAPADAEELRPLVEALGAPLVQMLGQLQFQDVTQQQIDFLARLSLILDQHMIDLAQQLGDRRSIDRVANFKEMFSKALDDCVMDSQREDHHAATGHAAPGLDLPESGGPKIEMF